MRKSSLNQDIFMAS